MTHVLYFLSVEITCILISSPILLQSRMNSIYPYVVTGLVEARIPGRHAGGPSCPDGGRQEEECHETQIRRSFLVSFVITYVSGPHFSFILPSLTVPSRRS